MTVPLIAAVSMAVDDASFVSRSSPTRTRLIRSMTGRNDSCSAKKRTMTGSFKMVLAVRR